MLLAFNEGPLVLCFTYSSLFQHNCIFIRILVACLEQRPPLDVNGYVVISCTMHTSMLSSLGTEEISSAVPHMDGPPQYPW